MTTDKTVFVITRTAERGCDNCAHQRPASLARCMLCLRFGVQASMRGDYWQAKGDNARSVNPGGEG